MLRLHTIPQLYDLIIIILQNLKKVYIYINNLNILKERSYKILTIDINNIISKTFYNNLDFKLIFLALI